ncbi:MAG: hypothetical protein BGO90_13790 [Legionella sp. 40-6]|nr:HAD-IA family hydrolase [Legionella sp.]OJX93208.1 MAG: hypothetical protein BGO90_13790 [Legionella sp. 40-6]
MKYDVILFDLDDTLIDFTAAERFCLQQIYERFYHQLEAPLFHSHFKTINHDLWLRVGALNDPLMPNDVRFLRFQQLNAVLNHAVDHLEVANAYEQLLGEHCHWITQAKPVIEFLHRTGHILGIITNGMTDSQARKYQRLELHRWFECFIVSENVGLAKPNKTIFELAVNNLAAHRKCSADFYAKERMLMVGDSIINDGQGAFNFGIHYCHVGINSFPASSQQTPVHYQLQSIAELPQSLGYAEAFEEFMLEYYMSVS